MIARILKSTASAITPFLYNEKKCLRGEADVVAVRNVKNDTQFCIMKAFKELEELPQVSARTRKKGFHMTVGAGENDKVNEMDIVALIHDLMKGMGYANQPYVVYRHNDIDREHYHVLAERVQQDGSIVDNQFEGVRVNKLLKELSQKYKFSVGLPNEVYSVKMQKDAYAQYYNSTGLKTDMIENIFADLLRFPLFDFQQVKNILSAYGVNVQRKKVKNFIPELGGTGYVLTFNGGNDNKSCRRWYCMEKDFKIQGDATLQKLFKENEKDKIRGMVSVENLIRAARVIDFALDKTEDTKDQNEFFSLIRPTGIELVVTGDISSDGKKDFVIVDKVKKTYITRKNLEEITELLNIDDKVNERDWNKGVITTDNGKRFSKADLLAINQSIDKMNQQYEEKQAKTIKEYFQLKLF